MITVGFLGLGFKFFFLILGVHVEVCKQLSGTTFAIFLLLHLLNLMDVGFRKPHVIDGAYIF